MLLLQSPNIEHLSVIKAKVCVHKFMTKIMQSIAQLRRQLPSKQFSYGEEDIYLMGDSISHSFNY